VCTRERERERERSEDKRSTPAFIDCHSSAVSIRGKVNSKTGERYVHADALNAVS